MIEYIDLNFIKIPTFGLMVASAFMICHYLLKKEFIKQKIEVKIIDDIIFYSVIAAIVGSKLYFVIEAGLFSEFISNISNIFKSLFSFDFSNAFSEMQTFGSGLTFNGGFICAVLFIYIYIHKNKLNFIKMADIITPFILLGHGIGRIGCFLVGDDYGIPTKLPWGVTFFNGHPESTITTFTTQFSFLGYDQAYLRNFLVEGSDNFISVHPTQFYEMFLYFLCFYLLRYLYNNKSFETGYIFSLYLIFHGLSRFIVEFVRTNARYEYLFNFSSAQIISIIMVLIGSIMVYRNHLNATPTNGNN